MADSFGGMTRRMEEDRQFYESARADARAANAALPAPVVAERRTDPEREVGAAAFRARAWAPDAVGLFHRLTGNDEAAEAAYRRADEWERRADERDSDVNPNLLEARSLGEGLAGARKLFIGSAPSLVAGMGGATAGAGLARRAAMNAERRAAVDRVTRDLSATGVQSPLARDAVRRAQRESTAAATPQVAQRQFGEALGATAAQAVARNPAARRRVSRATQAGMVAGGTLGTLPTMVSGNREAYRDAEDRGDVLAVLGSDTLAAGVGYAPLHRLLGRAGAPPAFRQKMEGTIRAQLARAARETAKEAGKQAASEGLSEGAQAFIQRAGHRYVNENIELFSREAFSDYAANVVGGAVLGGVMGGGLEAGTQSAAVGGEAARRTGRWTRDQYDVAKTNIKDRLRKAADKVREREARAGRPMGEDPGDGAGGTPAPSLYQRALDGLRDGVTGAKSAVDRYRRAWQARRAEADLDAEADEVIGLFDSMMDEDTVDTGPMGPLFARAKTMTERMMLARLDPAFVEASRPEDVLRLGRIMEKYATGKELAPVEARTLDVVINNPRSGITQDTLNAFALAGEAGLLGEVNQLARRMSRDVRGEQYARQDLDPNEQARAVTDEGEAVDTLEGGEDVFAMPTTSAPGDALRPIDQINSIRNTLRSMRERGEIDEGDRELAKLPGAARDESLPENVRRYAQLLDEGQAVQAQARRDLLGELSGKTEEVVERGKKRKKVVSAKNPAVFTEFVKSDGTVPDAARDAFEANRASAGKVEIIGGVDYTLDGQVQRRRALYDLGTLIGRQMHAIRSEEPGLDHISPQRALLRGLSELVQAGVQFDPESITHGKIVDQDGNELLHVNKKLALRMQGLAKVGDDLLEIPRDRQLDPNWAPRTNKPFRSPSDPAKVEAAAIRHDPEVAAAARAELARLEADPRVGARAELARQRNAYRQAKDKTSPAAKSALAQIKAIANNPSGWAQARIEALTAALEGVRAEETMSAIEDGQETANVNLIDHARPEGTEALIAREPPPGTRPHGTEMGRPKRSRWTRAVTDKQNEISRLRREGQDTAKAEAELEALLAQRPNAGPAYRPRTRQQVFSDGANRYVPDTSPVADVTFNSRHEDTLRRYRAARDAAKTPEAHVAAIQRFGEEVGMTELRHERELGTITDARFEATRKRLIDPKTGFARRQLQRALRGEIGGSSYASVTHARDDKARPAKGRDRDRELDPDSARESAERLGQPAPNEARERAMRQAAAAGRPKAKKPKRAANMSGRDSEKLRKSLGITGDGKAPTPGVPKPATSPGTRGEAPFKQSTTKNAPSDENVDADDTSLELHNRLGREGFAAAHDSPHKFDGNFNWRAHGLTGEGAQAFGAGTYLSTDNSVQRYYKGVFTAKVAGRRTKYEIENLRELIRASVRNIRDAKKDLAMARGAEPGDYFVEVMPDFGEPGERPVITRYSNKEAAERHAAQNHGFVEPRDTIVALLEEEIEKERLNLRLRRAALKKALNPDSGYLNNRSPTYHVSVAATADEILDWDVDVRKQPKAVLEKVKAALKEAGADGTLFNLEHGSMHIGGRQVYQALERAGGTQAWASDLLQKHGLVGHKYNAAGGKNDARPNYVIYDDSRITTNAVEFDEGPAPKKKKTVAKKDSDQEALAKRAEELKKTVAEAKAVEDKIRAEAQAAAAAIAAAPANKHNYQRESGLAMALLRALGYTADQVPLMQVRADTPGNTRAGAYNFRQGVILLSDAVTGRERVEVLSHEVGHAVIAAEISKATGVPVKDLLAPDGSGLQGEKWMAALEKANPELYAALRADYEAFRLSHGMDTSLLAMRAARSQPARVASIRQRARGLGLADRPTSDFRGAAYQLSMNEWLADHIGRALLQHKTGQSLVDKFFGDIARQLRRVFNLLFKGKGADSWRPAPSVEAWVSGMFDAHAARMKEATGRSGSPEAAQAAVTAAVIDGAGGPPTPPPPTPPGGTPPRHFGIPADSAVASTMRYIRAYLPPQEVKILGRALNTAAADKAIRAFFEGFPRELALLDSARSGAEARMAMGYIAWRNGALNLGPQGTGAFDSIRSDFQKALGQSGGSMRSVSDDVAKLFGLADSSDYVSRIFNDLASGRVQRRGASYDVRADEGRARGTRQQRWNEAARFYERTNDFIGRYLDGKGARLLASGFPEMRRLHALLLKPQGTTSDDPGYLPAVRNTVSRQSARLRKIHAKLQPRESHRAMTLLQRGTTDFSKEKPAVREAAEATRKIMDEMYSYLKDAGVDIGRRENFFPVMMDVTRPKDQARLRDLLSDPDYEEPIRALFKGFEAKRKRDGEGEVSLTAMIDDLVQGAAPATEVRASSSGPGFRGANHRSMQFIYDALAEARKAGDAKAIAKHEKNVRTFASLQTKDPADLLVRYLEPAVKQAERVRRFGKDDARIETLLERAKAKGATDAQIAEARDVVAVAFGTYGADGSPTLRALSPRLAEKFSGPRTRAFIQNMQAYQNLRLLPLATLTSMVDPLGIAVRSGGEFKDTWTAYKSGLRTVYNKASREEQAGMLELLGAADDMFAEVAIAQMGDTSFANRLNSWTFKYNGLQAWTRATRFMAMEAGHKFILRHAFDPAEKSVLYMRELGLRPGDVQTDFTSGKTRVRLLDQAERSALQAAGTAEAKAELKRDDRVRNGIMQFIDEAILRPNPMQTPMWVSDPYMGLVAQYKAFAYALYEQIYKRWSIEADRGNGKVLGAMMMYLPVMLAAEILREWVQNLGEDKRRDGWGITEYLALAAERTGLYSPRFAAAKDTWEDIERKQLPGTSQAGPTAAQARDVYRAFTGRRDLGEEVQRAMPAAALHRRWDEAVGL